MIWLKRGEVQRSVLGFGVAQEVESQGGQGWCWVEIGRGWKEGRKRGCAEQQKLTFVYLRALPMFIWIG
jgi:hypothetical protein